MAYRAKLCPWSNYPTHNKNRELRVNGFRPIVYGYCGDHEECASCAGTTYKPNLRVEQGRGFTFVPCPYCAPEKYQKKVEVLTKKKKYKKRNSKIEKNSKGNKYLVIYFV